MLILFVCCGCESQDVSLEYAPMEEAATNTPIMNTPAPSATPCILQIDPDRGSPQPTDNRGVAIIDETNHFFIYYVSFSNIRVYEEDQQCYVDAVCINGYDMTMTGKCSIVFFDKAGRQCGKGKFHTADSPVMLYLMPGENRVYAEVSSENDVSNYSFEIRNDGPFLPVE